MRSCLPTSQRLTSYLTDCFYLLHNNNVNIYCYILVYFTCKPNLPGLAMAVHDTTLAVPLTEAECG